MISVSSSSVSWMISALFFFHNYSYKVIKILLLHLKISLVQDIFANIKGNLMCQALVHFKQEMLSNCFLQTFHLSFHVIYQRPIEYITN